MTILRNTEAKKTSYRTQREARSRRSARINLVDHGGKPISGDAKSKEDCKSKAISTTESDSKYRLFSSNERKSGEEVSTDNVKCVYRGKHEKVRTVPDPAVQFVALQNNISVQSLVPELNVQEIDTVINVNSGQPIVMGGLLQDRSSSSQEAIPVLGEVPVVGSLFRSQVDSVSKTELVILLRATIVEGPDTISDTDRDIYKRFSNDRRPFDL